MNKKFSIVILTFLAFVGSVVTFYATNLLLSDVSNM